MLRILKRVIFALALLATGAMLIVFSFAEQAAIARAFGY